MNKMNELTSEVSIVTLATTERDLAKKLKFILQVRRQYVLLHLEEGSIKELINKEIVNIQKQIADDNVEKTPFLLEYDKHSDEAAEVLGRLSLLTHWYVVCHMIFVNVFIV